MSFVEVETLTERGGPFEVVLKKCFSEITTKRVGLQPVIEVVNEWISGKTYKLKERGIAEVDLTFCKSDSGRLKLAVGL